MSQLNNIRIVLVNTSHPGNIGATARAMKNMGLQKLVLVAPRDFPSGVAVGRAASATDILDEALVVGSLQEAIADCGLVVGASARSRHIPWPLLEPDACATQIISAAASNEVALVFGREDSGLSNEELMLCHYHVQIPTNEGYSSLNLAAAVMVLCYELRKAWLSASGRRGELLRVPEGKWDRELATVRDLDLFLDHLERVLVRLDFHDPENPRKLMERLRRLYGRIQPDKMEINILRGILTATEQKLDK